MPGGEGRRRPVHSANIYGGSDHAFPGDESRAVAGAMGGNDRGETQFDMPGRKVLVEKTMVGDPAIFENPFNVLLQGARPAPIPSKAPGSTLEPYLEYMVPGGELGLNIDILF